MSVPETQADLQWPGSLKGLPAHLLSEASNPPTDPPTIARVGAYLDATNEELWWPVDGSPAQAQAVIDRNVAALILERFPQPAPAPVVVIERNDGIQPAEASDAGSVLAQFAAEAAAPAPDVPAAETPKRRGRKPRSK